MHKVAGDRERLNNVELVFKLFPFQGAGKALSTSHQKNDCSNDSFGLCSEATIAKRRSYANTISYLTPPAENAGLYKGLKELKELIGSYQVRGGPSGLGLNLLPGTVY